MKNRKRNRETKKVKERERERARENRNMGEFRLRTQEIQYLNSLFLPTAVSSNSNEGES